MPARRLCAVGTRERRASTERTRGRRSGGSVPLALAREIEDRVEAAMRVRFFEPVARIFHPMPAVDEELVRVTAGGRGSDGGLPESAGGARHREAIRLPPGPVADDGDFARAIVVELED